MWPPPPATGLATTPFDLGRIVVNLDEIPLGVIDDNVNFNLQTILPDSLDLDGRAGIDRRLPGSAYGW